MLDQALGCMVDGKSDRCQFVGDQTCSIFDDHVAVSDLRSVFTIPPNLPIRLHHTPRVTCIPPRVTLPCTRAPLLSSNSYTHHGKIRWLKAAQAFEVLLMGL